MDKYFGKWKKGTKPVEEKPTNKGNVNNEYRGQKPRVWVKISDCDIVGDTGLRRYGIAIGQVIARVN